MECTIHVKTFKMIPFPATTIIFAAGMRHDAKIVELLWENCTLKLKMMTKAK